MRKTCFPSDTPAINGKEVRDVRLLVFKAAHSKKKETRRTEKIALTLSEKASNMAIRSNSTTGDLLNRLVDSVEPPLGLIGAGHADAADVNLCRLAVMIVIFGHDVDVAGKRVEYHCSSPACKVPVHPCLFG